MPCPTHSTPLPAAWLGSTFRLCAEPVTYATAPAPLVPPGQWDRQTGRRAGRGPVAVARRFLAGAAAGRSKRLGGQARTDTERDYRLALVLPQGRRQHRRLEIPGGYAQPAGDDPAIPRELTGRIAGRHVHVARPGGLLAAAAECRGGTAHGCRKQRRLRAPTVRSSGSCESRARLNVPR